MTTFNIPEMHEDNKNSCFYKEVRFSLHNFIESFYIPTLILEGYMNNQREVMDTLNTLTNIYECLMIPDSSSYAPVSPILSLPDNCYSYEFLTSEIIPYIYNLYAPYIDTEAYDEIAAEDEEKDE